MSTPLDALIEALIRAAAYNPASEVPPEVVLWCDERREFVSLLPSLRARLPQLLTYGDYDPAARTGPAVWLRAAAGRALPDLELTGQVVPIVYLPGVGREMLRAAEDCPLELKLLVWWTVAGDLFGHVNGKDWTLRAFLAAERGPLKLDVPDDAATRTALGLAAIRLCATPLEQLRGRRLDVDALHALLAPDLAADTLDWLEGRLDPASDPERFAAFAAQAKKVLKIDPAATSRHDGAVRLAAREGRWADVWERFAESGGDAHAGVVALLRTLQAPDLLADRSPYPKVNEDSEKQLRQELGALRDVDAATAKARITQLEAEHAWRRETVWAKRKEAPLADALGHLAALAQTVTLVPHDADGLVSAYVETGWKVDQAALDALASAPRATDREAVSTALRAAYLPWLDEWAAALQGQVQAGKISFAMAGDAGKKDVLVFVDGLRMDLAQRLTSILRTAGATAELDWRWSGFPTVTATCKPLVSPVAKMLQGPAAAGELYPVAGDGKPAKKPVLMKLLADAGWETAETLLPDGKSWREAGSFDELGHDIGVRLVDRLETDLADLADRVLTLARAGRHVQVLTDHGWLLLPGGLPTCTLEPGLVEPHGKRSRCALVKPAATTTYVQVPWTWNPEVVVATATGARSFLAGQEYAHGGISPQECILPVITVSAVEAEKRAKIVSALWEGLRLRVVVEGGADLPVELLDGSGTSGEPIAKGRVLDEHGQASFLVTDDRYLGEEVSLVVRDEHRGVLATQTLIVGGA